jgi:anti-sigma-K factor RskA
VNLQEYIASGIIESYVLGFASEKEKAEFERLLRKHPELVQVMENFELSLEKEALANAIEPPAHLKEKILTSIQEEGTKPAAKVVTIYPQKATRRISSKAWAVAASIILLLGCAYMVYTFYTVNQQLKKDIAQSKDNLEKLEEKKRLIEETIVPPSYQAKPAKVAVPQQEIPPVFEVFWDSTSAHVYLIIKHLKQLPVGQRYELWAVTKGKKESLGIFDPPPPEDDKLIIKMDNVQEAESFAITIFDPGK